jgi:hypothetical protein
VAAHLAGEAAAGKSSTQLTPSITLEESEWALRASNLSAFIDDAKLMATNLLPGEHVMHAAWCAGPQEPCLFDAAAAQQTNTVCLVNSVGGQAAWHGRPMGRWHV